MELTLLTVPACPNAAAFEQRLAAALAGHPDAVVHRREIADEREAAQVGMHGSPTLLVDGVDPFAAPGQPPCVHVAGLIAQRMAEVEARLAELARTLG